MGEFKIFTFNFKNKKKVGPIYEPKNYHAFPDFDQFYKKRKADRIVFQCRVCGMTNYADYAKWAGNFRNTKSPILMCYGCNNPMKVHLFGAKKQDNYSSLVTLT